ncbi:MAG: hypothetical protein ACPGQM_10560 [Alphaproteobacteria bacterium]
MNSSQVKAVCLNAGDSRIEANGNLGSAIDQERMQTVEHRGEANEHHRNRQNSKKRYRGNHGASREL